MQALDGGAAGSAARTEEDDVGAGEFQAKRLADGGGEAVAVGVVAAPAGGGAEQGVDGADGEGGGIDLGDTSYGENLVRDSEVEAVKIFSVKQIEGAGEVVGVHFEPEVAPVGKRSVGGDEGGERGVVERRADGVLDRMAQDGEGGAGERPAVEISEGKDRGVFEFSFQRSNPSGGARGPQKGN